MTRFDADQDTSPQRGSPLDFAVGEMSRLTLTTVQRAVERPRNRDGRGALRERETTTPSWRA